VPSPASQDIGPTVVGSSHTLNKVNMSGEGQEEDISIEPYSMMVGEEGDDEREQLGRYFRPHIGRARSGDEEIDYSEEEEEEEMTDSEVYHDENEFDMQIYEEEAFNDAFDQLEFQGSGGSLDLDLPSNPQHYLSEAVIHRIADYLQNDLKRDVSRLSFRESSAGPVRFDAIQRILSPSSLVHLTLNGPMGDDTAGELVRTVLGGRFKALKKLVLWKSGINDGTILRDVLHNNPQLELLFIGDRNGPYSSEALTELSKGLAGHQLQSLDMGICHLGDSGFQTLIDSVSTCASLRELVLQLNGLGAPSLSLIIPLLEQGRLELLRINANPDIFEDASQDTVKSFGAAACKSLKNLSVFGTGLTDRTIAVLLESLCRSIHLETLCVDLAEDESCKALEVCLPKFKALRSLQFGRRPSNGWTDDLTQSVLRNTTLYEVKSWDRDADHRRMFLTPTFWRHFQSNKLITKAKKLLDTDARASDGRGIPLGYWPTIIHHLGQEPWGDRAPRETATYMIVRSQIVNWIQNSRSKTGVEDKKHGATSTKVSALDAGQKPSKRPKSLPVYLENIH